MNTISRKRRIVKTKAHVLERLKHVLEIAVQIERLARSGDDALSDLIEDISWSTGDCAIGKEGEFDPPDYIYNVICQVREGGLFSDKLYDPTDNISEPYFIWLKELIQELKPSRTMHVSDK